MCMCVHVYMRTQGDQLKKMLPACTQHYSRNIHSGRGASPSASTPSGQPNRCHGSHCLTFQRSAARCTAHVDIPSSYRSPTNFATMQDYFTLQTRPTIYSMRSVCASKPCSASSLPLLPGILPSSGKSLSRASHNRPLPESSLLRIASR